MTKNKRAVRKKMRDILLLVKTTYMSEWVKRTAPK